MSETEDDLPGLSLADLSPDVDNPFLHDAKNREIVANSLEEVGGARSIVIDENNRILVGNNTTTEALKRGMKLVVVDGDRDTIVAVRRTDLSEYEKTRLTMLDNKSSDLHKANQKAIARIVEKNPGQKILDGVFTPKEQEKLLKKQADAQAMAPGGSDEEAPELKQPAKAPESSVRMVSLFMTTETQPVWMRRVRNLGKLLGTSSITDTIMAVVEKAEKEWIPVAEPVALPTADSTEGEALSLEDNTVGIGAV
jgi:ribosomal protein L7Ae-like RNA K-turn-binding protein